MNTFDQTQAATEGWGLFDINDLGPVPDFVIQKDDESAIFARDSDALKYVVAQASVGSEYHREALILAQCWPKDFPLLAAARTIQETLSAFPYDIDESGEFRAAIEATEAIETWEPS